MYLKFCKIDCHSISNLKSNSLYAAVPNQLNDPFEAMCTTKSAKAMYNLDGVIHYHEQVKRYNTRRAIICLVKTDDANYVRQNLLMWSHYADSHRGFCVEYNTAHICGELACGKLNIFKSINKLSFIALRILCFKYFNFSVLCA